VAAAGVSLGAGLLIASPAGAQVSELEAFRDARRSFDEARYQEAAQKLESLVGGEEPAIDDPILVQESRKYLGVTYLYLDRRQDADEQFRRMLRKDPDYPPLDPQTWPPAVVSAFEESRTDLRAETQAREEVEAARDRARREDLEERTQAYITLLEDQAREQRRVIEGSRWLALLPFGVGQFQNGHDGLGWALLVSEAGLTVTSIVTGLLHGNLDPVEAEAENATPGSFERVERTYRLTNWVSTALLGALVLVGILDAQLRFVPERVVFEERPLPPDPRGAREDGDVDAAGPSRLGSERREAATGGPRFEVGPGGVGLRF